MKLTLTPTFLLVLNLSAAVASHQHLRARQLTNTTDTTKSHDDVGGADSQIVHDWKWADDADSTSSDAVSPAPTTSEPTAAPEPTSYPTVEPCSTLVAIGYYDDYSWSELPDCVQEAGKLVVYPYSGTFVRSYSDSSCVLISS